MADFEVLRSQLRGKTDDVTKLMTVLICEGEGRGGGGQMRAGRTHPPFLSAE